MTFKILLVSLFSALPWVLILAYVNISENKFYSQTSILKPLIHVHGIWNISVTTFLDLYCFSQWFSGISHQLPNAVCRALWFPPILFWRVSMFFFRFSNFLSMIGFIFSTIALFFLGGSWFCFWLSCWKLYSGKHIRILQDGATREIEF